MTASADSAPAAPEAQGGAFSPVMGLGLALVGIFAFLAMLVLGTLAPELHSGNDGDTHALSRSGIGFAGLAALLKAEGEPVVILRRPPPMQGPGQGHGGLLIVTPAMQGDPKALEQMRFGGPMLIVLPKHAPIPHMTHPGWVMEGDNFDTGEIAQRLLKQVAPGTVIDRARGSGRPVLTGEGELRGRSLTPGPVKDLQSLRGNSLDALLLDGEGRMVLASVRTADRRRVYILSEPDLLNTAGVADIDTARAADSLVRWLRADDGPVLFDVTLHGYQRERSLIRSALGPPFLAMTACLLFTAFLMGLHALARFGPPRRPARAFAFGKQALADNAADLIRMARREPRMGAPYAALTRAMVARAITAPRGMSDKELDAFFDRLGDKAATTHRWSALIGRAAKARDTYDMLSAARAIHAWRREMTREP